VDHSHEDGWIEWKGVRYSQGDARLQSSRA
jgi:hypothetical protein